ncbi:hypothetical protein PAAG_11538 [Paracoccidioides lutzii Pb01]|uniref:Uncharacterized protein n=1 Tax=Paracoccidioides lutzii (strain ATCC MYA-826 / Pb01) TaxID=502779 RepID=A0A0A2V5V2_PARBA|nr:hypothetical protein PAAG_11538 [Paracoccidioides lutzii Pb01]KGQ01692.1 hypothetical protein PAAG_11538 [Paracoccidioides lutzii Pb01]
MASDEIELFSSDNLSRTAIAVKAKFHVPWLYREDYDLDPRRNSHFFLQTHGITTLKWDLTVVEDMMRSQSTYVQGPTVFSLKLIQPATTVILQLVLIDWNPYPPDNSTGVWWDVELSQTGLVSISSPPRIVTDFAEPGVREVKVTVKTDMRNNVAESMRGMPEGVIKGDGSSRITRAYALECPYYFFRSSERLSRTCRVVWHENGGTLRLGTPKLLDQTKPCITYPGRWEVLMIERFTRRCALVMGKPTSLEDYLTKVQTVDYEATLAQFESYAVRKSATRPATGLHMHILDVKWSLANYALESIRLPLKPHGIIIWNRNGHED